MPVNHKRPQSQVLPPALAQSDGVVVRREAGQMEVDHQLKLRIANAIHTAMVYLMVGDGWGQIK